MEEFLAGVLQNGFSVAVAAYLLIRMENRLEKLSQAINDLKIAIAEGPANAR
ncbi:MAG: YvrJ family protein [Dethiosulfovibrio peptidovorans]|nr:MAG: YvrJ family protein [Dethiosulfovibrio peptidovorans]